MKTLVGVIVGLMLSGCGPGPAYEYKSGCATFTSNEPVDEFVLEVHVVEATKLIDANWGSGAFCRLPARYPIEIRPGNWPCLAYVGAGGICAGEVTLGHMKIAQGDRALVHEAIHILQADSVQIDTMWHANWEVLGFNALDIQFRYAVPVL